MEASRKTEGKSKSKGQAGWHGDQSAFGIGFHWEKEPVFKTFILSPSFCIYGSEMWTEGEARTCGRFKIPVLIYGIKTGFNKVWILCVYAQSQTKGR